MTHFILASAGTHGDVFPYIALGLQLRDRGHRVTLAVNESYQDLAEELGLEFAALMSEEDTQRLISNPDIWHPVKSAIIGARWGVSRLEEQYELLSQLSADAGDVLAASPAILAARLVQEKLQRPLATIYHLPWTIISCSNPPAMTSGFTLPRWMPEPFGRMYWWGFDLAARMLMGTELNGFRKKLQLPKVTRPFRWWTSPDLAIGLFADWYAVPQPDWIPQLKVSGFPVFDGVNGESLDSDVLEFCKAYTPPLVFTFGTGMLHAHKLFAAAVDACRKLNRPGILLARDGDQIPDSSPETVRHVEYASLKTLLPHCSAIVHHGGMGTTARALAAGTPQLIIPHAWDQLDNARRVMDLGAGTMLRRGRCSGDRLAKSLQKLNSTQITNACQIAAERFDQSEGLVPAAKWLEEYADAGSEAGSR